MFREPEKLKVFQLADNIAEGVPVLPGPPPIRIEKPGSADQALLLHEA